MHFALPHLAALAALLAAPLEARAADNAVAPAGTPEPETSDPAGCATSSGPQTEACVGSGVALTPELPADPPPGRRLFPLGGNWARARGYRLPEPWGFGIVAALSSTQFRSADLAVAVSKGAAPPADAELTPLPAVTTSRLEGDNNIVGVKGDLWIFPGVNVFASLGKVTGTNHIDVAIDLDAVIPFPFCRPAKPCGTVPLPIEAKVDNTAFTFGTLLVYGNEHWFVLGSIAKTISISHKERSDVRSTNLSLRAGPRFRIGQSYFVPYVGINYFKFRTRVRGVVASGPLFEDGDPVSMRYDVALETLHPWAGVTGASLELTPNLWIQAEVQAGATSTRAIGTTTLRF